MLLFVPPDDQAAVKKVLSRLICVPFDFDFMGSQIIYYRPDPIFAEVEAARSGSLVQPFQELATLANTTE